MSSNISASKGESAKPRQSMDGTLCPAYPVFSSKLTPNLAHLKFDTTLALSASTTLEWTYKFIRHKQNAIVTTFFWRGDGLRKLRRMLFQYYYDLDSSFQRPDTAFYEVLSSVLRLCTNTQKAYRAIFHEEKDLSIYCGVIRFRSLYKIEHRIKKKKNIIHKIFKVPWYDPSPPFPPSYSE